MQLTHGTSKRVSASGMRTGLPMSFQRSPAGFSQCATPVRELNQ